MPVILLEKYNIPVPRYTSYPPANHFIDQAGNKDHTMFVDMSNNWDPRHIALYVHIPFCRKICFYCGCNACTLRSNNEVEAYISALMCEIEMVSDHIDKKRLVTQVHFGGGTPNSIPSEKITGIVEFFKKKFNFALDAEIAIETNPAYLDKDYIDHLITHGFNRFSFGIQDLNTDVLAGVNREPSALPLNELISYVRNKNSKAAINLDFIYGLPGQDVAGFTETMEQAAALNPDRMVTFSYAHVPWLKKHQQILEKRGLPGAEEKTKMFLAGYNVLTSKGYQPIGLDHYVSKDDELYNALKNNQLHRNFQGYCTRQNTGQVYAFGVSAISQLEKVYLQNTKSVEKYINLIIGNRSPVEKRLEVTDDQIITREVITHLMCNKKIQWSSMTKNLNIAMEKLKNVIRYDQDLLSGFEQDGLIEYDDESILITETGSMFIRNIAASLDPEYKEQVNKYSKAL
ncbi:MAG: oxygen-independent coproporphyrinogen III oxidase [Bacteroidales bacterium]|nr:oxygen-independent coproporphyrinogen III oxidase [Bacteroidales bacterium]